jgi:competence protein ComEC
MKGAAPAEGNAGVRLAAWAGALLLGAALQLQQPRLSSGAAYSALLVAGLAAFGVAWRWRRAWWAAALGLACIAFATTGLRAQARLAEALPAALEGRDLVVTGVVSQMPRRLADGVRFTFDVERATLQGRRCWRPTTAWPRGSAGTSSCA